MPSMRVKFLFPQSEKVVAIKRGYDNTDLMFKLMDCPECQTWDFDEITLKCIEGDEDSTSFHVWQVSTKKAMKKVMKAMKTTKVMKRKAMKK
jgi:hypothetical protein